VAGQSVEPIKLVSPERREAALRAAGYNVFRLSSDDVFVDLLTDSGTAAMSADQWAGIQVGDESYAGARNWFRLEDSVRHVSGLPYVIISPTSPPCSPRPTVDGERSRVERAVRQCIEGRQFLRLP
jgi:tryptophanase